VREIVRAVLDGERAGAASLSVTFVTAARMRNLNRRAFGRRGETDVIAFGLPHAGRLAGDVYVGPAVARRSARALGIGIREEVARLVVHGTLHVLGHDHPAGDARARSPMWRRQETYVRRWRGMR
jgi:probable rRNA maturation factor